MEKRKRISRIISLIFALLLLSVAVFGLSSCGLLAASLEGVTIVNTKINDSGELIVYFSDGTYQNAGKIANNETNVTIDGSGENVSASLSPNQKLNSARMRSRAISHGVPAIASGIEIFSKTVFSSDRFSGVIKTRFPFFHCAGENRQGVAMTFPRAQAIF